MALLRSAVRSRYAPFLTYELYPMPSLLKKILKTLQIPLILIAIFAIQHFCHTQTAGFSIAKITAKHPFNLKWETAPLTQAETERLDPILAQKFTFFKHGGQSYVFLSEDGKTVLKVFKHHHMRVPTWFKKLPLPAKWKRFHHKFIKNKELKLPAFFKSCTLAYNNFQQRTGLIYLHLNQTAHLKKKLILIDKLNISHALDLDTLDFAIQERTELPHDHFLRLRKENNLASAKESIDSLLNLIAERCEKGIFDRDPCIRRNCGFIGNKAVDIDLGSYIEKKSVKLPFITQAELYYKTLKFQQWLKKKYPEASRYFDAELQQRLKG